MSHHDPEPARPVPGVDEELKIALREVVKTKGEPGYIQVWAVAPPEMWQTFQVTESEWTYDTEAGLPVRTIIAYRLVEHPLSENRNT